MPCPYSRLSKNPPSPFLKKDRRGRSRPSPTKKGDLEGFLSAQRDFDITLAEDVRRFISTSGRGIFKAIFYALETI